MMLTLTQAAKATGKSKSTILRAIKTGRISASKGEVGVFLIDAAELHRVFPFTIDSPSDSAVTHHDADVLQCEVALLREQLDREREFNRQLSSLLGEEREERRKLTAMLTHQPESKADTPSASPEARAAVRPWLWVVLAVASVAAAIAQWLVYR